MFIFYYQVTEWKTLAVWKQAILTSTWEEESSYYKGMHH